jgi:coenzyme F420-reducing hydrogenase delta subunit/ferredoxin
MHPLRAIRLHALAGFRRLERVFDSAFGSGLNPLRHLGALGFMLFWLLAISGIYLYMELDTSAEGAYRSIDRLSREPWRPGGILRSLHRYAADGLIVVTLAHLLREGLYGRYSGFRRFSWLTGIPLLLLGYVNAIGGFWLNWDLLGQFSAVATAEWLDRLPLFGSPMTRNFLGAGAVSDRLFSLFVFVHIGVPLLLVFALWFHVQRVARATVFPPRRLAIGTAVTLLALALAAPVASQGPANLAVAPTALAYDWPLLFVHPLTYSTSPEFVWFALAGALLVLFALPAMPQPAPAPIAAVDAENCNGCRRCFDDCPYAAVTMVPHPARGMRQLAQVDADLCASCGICVGACPSSSPFRRTAELVTGIDMPSAPIGMLRRRLVDGLAALGNQPCKIAVFGCDHGVDVRRLAGPDVAAFSLMCAAQLPPSFVEYALRDGAAGVLVTGCAEGSCEYRLGQRWTADRLHGTREPHLRASVPRERLALAWAGAGDEAALRQALQSLRQRLTTATGPTSAEATSTHG